MPKVETISWRNYENETLIHNHKMAKIYKKRYQRAADFENSLYRFFGLITVVSSTVASTLSWGIGSNNGSSNDGDENDSQQLLISSITTVSAVAAAIQNFYKFQENANNNIITAKAYAKLQNKIEAVGNIHPDYRVSKPNTVLRKIQDKFDQISDNRMELSNCMSKHLYTKKGDDESYLEMKHTECLEKEKKDNINIQYENDNNTDS
jgi:hypothetical protein